LQNVFDIDVDGGEVEILANMGTGTTTATPPPPSSSSPLSLMPYYDVMPIIASSSSHHHQTGIEIVNSSPYLDYQPQAQRPPENPIVSMHSTSDGTTITTGSSTTSGTNTITTTITITITTSTTTNALNDPGVAQ